MFGLTGNLQSQNLLAVICHLQRDANQIMHVAVESL